MIKDTLMEEGVCDVTSESSALMRQVEQVEKKSKSM